MARPYWSRQLRISLGFVGVKLFLRRPNRRARFSFREIDRRTAQRIRHQNVTESVGPVDPRMREGLRAQ